MPLGIDFTQIFLHLFNVVILFGGLYILLFAPVKKFMAGREEHYRKMDEEAKGKVADAEKLRADYEQKLSAVESEISEKKRAADAALFEDRKRQEADAKEAAKKIVADAKADAEKQRSAIVDGAREDITRLIDEAAKKMMLPETDGNPFDAFLADAERSV